MSDKSVPNYPDNVSEAIQQVIDRVILQDEGGYVLSTDRDGGDGGWTYAGITKLSFIRFANEYGSLSIKEMVALVSTGGDKLTDLKNAVREIYIHHYINADMQESPPALLAARLSCSINCGLPEEQDIYSFSDKSLKNFCYQWQLHYIDIVKHNPVKLQYLHGWTARVWKYLP